MRMKRFICPIIFTLMALLTGACSNDVIDELPSAISRFISQYYPNSGVSSYSETDNIYKVKVSGGPTMIFDEACQWTEIDGNGVRLPQVLCYDEFPPALYEYLQSAVQQDDVYAVKRDKRYYKLTMLDTVLTYNIQTGEVTYPGKVKE